MAHKLQNGLRSQEGIDNHILDRFGGFMVVDAPVKFEAGCTKVINLVRNLEVVTNLKNIDACRVYEPKDIITSL